MLVRGEGRGDSVDHFDIGSQIFLPPNRCRRGIRERKEKGREKKGEGGNEREKKVAGEKDREGMLQLL